jgi:hypothetical protein
MTPQDENLGHMGVYASLYSTHVNSPIVPILEWLNKNNLNGLTMCPGCGLYDFQHIEKCEFMAKLQPVMDGLRQAVEDGGRPDLLMKERQVKRVKLT